MNKQLRHLAVVATVLIAVLIGFTTYWQSWAGAELANKQGNAVQNIVQLEIDRGSIFAANGTRLAWSIPHKKGGLTTYSRKYTPNGAFAITLPDSPTPTDVPAPSAGALMVPDTL